MAVNNNNNNKDDDISSFGSSSSDLLCNEETKGLCFDDDDFVEHFDDQSSRSNGGDGVDFSSRGSYLEASAYLPCLSEQCIGWMVERESEHLPRDDYLERLKNGDLDVSLRRWALGWMFKACTHYNYGESCLYSAMSYFDRFLSVYEFPGDRRWAIQLISVACLSLAAKIEEVNVPSTVALQAGEPKFLFEAKTIQRMEILVLNRLDWKIKAYTPCSFIDYYLRKMNGGEFPSMPVINRSLQIIISTIQGIEFLEFRPSEIAATVAVFVLGEKMSQAMDIDKAVFGLVGIEKERVEKCLELVGNSSTNGISVDYFGEGSEPSSPNGVLEAGSWLSYKSDETTAVESCPSSSHTSPETKRRKLDQTPTVGDDC